MVRDFVKKVVVWCLILVLGILPVGTVLVGDVAALDDFRLKKFSNYQIYFYDPDAEKCEPGTTIPGEGGNPYPYVGDEKWDGSCTGLSSERAAWIEKYLSPMQQVASSNGLPWELIAAQKFKESGTPGQNEALPCANNPLGLKANKEYIQKGKYCVVNLSNGNPAKFAKFDSVNEAFQYYANTAAMSKVKYKYPNDPYSAVAYVQSGNPPYYAVCDDEIRYPECKGRLGQPTPGYVKSTSSIICGIQKWAKSKGIAISTVTWENYSASTESGDPAPEPDPDSGESTAGTGAIYCDEDGNPSNGEEDDDSPEAGDLASYVKAWAHPNYHAPTYTEQMPAYKQYMDEHPGAYKGGCNGNDCGAFVANIMIASGWDTNYKQDDVSEQKRYLKDHWHRVDFSELKLGDVGVKNTPKSHHVILYVGNISGFNSKTASASQCERAPMAGRESDASLKAMYDWYRK